MTPVSLFRLNAFVTIIALAGLVSCATGGKQEASKAEDEFGVATGGHPPAIPPGFRTKEEFWAAATAGTLDMVMVDPPHAVA